MQGPVIAALYRHPVKGFSPEILQSAELIAGKAFPCDRLFAVEDGPSGFDISAPRHISKMRFAVLARSARLARLGTHYEADTGVFCVTLPDDAKHEFNLLELSGREAFAAFLADYLTPDFKGRLNVLQTVGDHRFMDHHSGDISILNLASLRALSDQLGQDISPLRFRMNIHLDGLEAWSEDALQPGARFQLGAAELEVVSPTRRCKATHANPVTGDYDLDLVPELRRHFDRVTLGFYARVIKSRTVSVCDDFRVGDAQVSDD